MVAAADAVNEAADPVGLALYAGYRGELLVDDVPGRAMQFIDVLRELRGSAHLLAVRASGVDARTAHFITAAQRLGHVRVAGRRRARDRRRAAGRPRAARGTHGRPGAPAFAVLDDAGAAALLRGLDDMAVALTD